MGIQQRVDDAAAKLRPTCTLQLINDTLDAVFKGLLHASGFPDDPQSAPHLYQAAVKQGLYSKNQLLRTDYRECAILALLASQGAGSNLALHVFIALMAGMSADQILNVVFLTGIYSGINVFTSSLRVVMKTFDAVMKAADAGFTLPKDLFIAIAHEFPDAAYDMAKERLDKIAG